MKTLISAFLLFFVIQFGFSQDSVMYTKDFVFKEGIYITFRDFKNNNPPLTPENFKQYNTDIDYLPENLFEEKFFHPRHAKLIYPDSLYERKRIDVDSIFGFCIKNEIYFYVNRKDILFLCRTLKKGKVSFLWGQEDAPRNLIDLRINPDGTPQGHYVLKERSFLLSFDTGNVYKYHLENFSVLLQKKDPELYKEFSKLSSKKQKDSMFIYLNKLNERNPVYFKVKN